MHPLTCSSGPSFKTTAMVNQRQDIERNSVVTELVVLKESSPDKMGKGPLEAHLRASWEALTHANCLAIPLPEKEEAAAGQSSGAVNVKASFLPGKTEVLREGPFSPSSSRGL